ncbi:MAG: MBL fold metallo-hydrolase [Crocinitomicaceae bacterium]|nr:MBL fold metallo-hydrolase [Crocinitomicaceae bacterium]
MKLEQLYTNCLAQGAYFIAHNGEAAVIDPLREVDQYIELAKANNATIKYIFETHFHADFVSGHVDLARKTGATIVFGPTAKTSFDCLVATDNQEFKIGGLTIRLLHTPGHTLESSCFLLIDESGKEIALFSGDTLFLGDVGRPDLAIKSDLTKEDLAGMSFDSLRNKIMTLPDDVVVYPAHGAGSACGKNMSKETQDLLGNQKKTNYALRADMTREEFIKEVTDGIMPPPQYFPKNALLNKTGYHAVDEVISKGTSALSLAEFKHAVENGALILDVRNQADFVQGHIPNSLFIGIDGQFAVWAGTLIENINQPIVLITPEGREKEAVTRLARVGYDNTLGYLEGGVASWDGSLSSIDSVEASALENVDCASIVDVRKPGEYQAEHVENCIHYPLDFMQFDLNKLNTDKPLYVHCAGGYRSVIAISLLKQKGNYTNLINVLGGYGAICKTNVPTTEFVCSSKKSV